MQVFLNADYMPLEQARISPLDRGFLFGDGIYEVIPCIEGRWLGFDAHIARLSRGLAALAIAAPEVDWHVVATTLAQTQPLPHQALYIQISRGEDTQRFHGFDGSHRPTVFAYCFPINGFPDASAPPAFRVKSEPDRRWQHCDIKSTSLLGNVLHFQAAHKARLNETLLFNGKDELTEASASNVFVIKDNEIATPPLDNQILPGITRALLIEALGQYPEFSLSERVITRQQVMDADEVWLTSATKTLVPVIELDGQLIGKGRVGPLYRTALTAFIAFLRRKGTHG